MDTTKRRVIRCGNIELLLKTKFLQCDTNVNLLVSPFRQPFSHETELWLNKVKWETTNFHAMTGSETDILVAFIDDKYVNLESISRAKKQLILVSL